MGEEDNRIFICESGCKSSQGPAHPFITLGTSSSFAISPKFLQVCFHNIWFCYTCERLYMCMIYFIIYFYFPTMLLWHLYLSSQELMYFHLHIYLYIHRLGLER